MCTIRVSIKTHMKQNRGYYRYLSISVKNNKWNSGKLVDIKVTYKKFLARYESNINISRMKWEMCMSLNSLLLISELYLMIQSWQLGENI